VLGINRVLELTNKHWSHRLFGGKSVWVRELNESIDFTCIQLMADLDWYRVRKMGQDGLSEYFLCSHKADSKLFSSKFLSRLKS
jgi:hypothetical protein